MTVSSHHGSLSGPLRTSLNLSPYHGSLSGSLCSPHVPSLHPPPPLIIPLIPLLLIPLLSSSPCVLSALPMCHLIVILTLDLSTLPMCAST